MPLVSSVTGCSTCSRVFTSRKLMTPVAADEVLDRAGAVVVGLAADRLGRLVDRARAARRSGTAPAPPRPASGCAAAASSPGCRRRSRCRAGRPAPGPRRAAACPGSARRSTRRGRTRPAASRTATPYSSGISSILRAIFMPAAAAAERGLDRDRQAVLARRRRRPRRRRSPDPCVPGTSGAPARSAMCRAVTLSPRSRIDLRATGRSRSARRRSPPAAKSAFSDRKP